MIISLGLLILEGLHLNRISLELEVSVKIRLVKKKRNLRLILEVDGLTWELRLDSKKNKTTT
jgi:transcriptional antiterminator Rof (Rho-off)